MKQEPAVLSAGGVWCCRFLFCTLSWWGMVLSVFIVYFQLVGYGVVGFHFVLSAGGVWCCRFFVLYICLSIHVPEAFI